MTGRSQGLWHVDRANERISGHVGQAEGIEDAAKDFRLAALEHNAVGGLAKKGGYYETGTIDISSLFNYYSNPDHVVHLRYKIAPRKQRQRGQQHQQFTTRTRPVSCRPIW